MSCHHRRFYYPHQFQNCRRDIAENTIVNLLQFFIDKDNCVSCLMFNNTSVNEFNRMLEPLLYERKSLCDVVVTVKPERVQSKNDPGKTWFIGRFSYTTAPDETVKEMREYVKANRVYRNETLTVSAQHKLVSSGYYMALDPLDDYSAHAVEDTSPKEQWKADDGASENELKISKKG